MLHVLRHITKSFKQDNGHIDVSISNENTRSLGLWLDRQRIFVRHYEEATSTTNQAISYKHRYELLLSIGVTGLGGKLQYTITAIGSSFACCFCSAITI